MEVDPQEITEEFILELTSAPRLNLVQELNISGQGVIDLDWTLLSKCTSLQHLDLSSNFIRQFPKWLSLKSLLSLNLSDNHLVHVDFLEQFPNLQTVKLQGNNIEVSDQHIAVECCPNLHSIDNQLVESLRTKNNNFKHKLLKQLEITWYSQYDEAFPHGIPHKKIPELTAELAATAKLHLQENIPETLCDFLLNRLITQMIIDIGSGLYKPIKEKAKELLPGFPSCISPRKRQSLLISESPTKIPKGSPQKQLEAMSPNRLRSPFKQINSLRDSPAKTISPSKSVVFKSPQKTPVKKVKTPIKKLEKVLTQKKGEQKIGTVNLLAVDDYDPIHFIRCHFGDREAKKHNCNENDPKDEYTKVWHCAFEPHPKQEDKETGIVATCGGNVVCLIDCSTGHVMKRFKHEGEQFYCLAWTTLAIETKHENQAVERPTNILAVGGYNGYICLLHPDQFMCYKQWGSGLPNKSVQQGAYYCSALVFHPEKPTWLFRGASDETVTLLDIGIPSGPKHETDVRTLMIFNSSNEILSLAVHTCTGHLVAGSDDGIVTWKMPTEEPKKSSVRKQIDTELEMPSGEAVDGMVLVNEKIIASKCVGDGCIYLWSLSEVLSSVKHGVGRIKPLVTLEWKHSKERYIQLGSANGLLACGDDEGNIWLYNVKHLLQKKAERISKEIYRPSRILLWPDCDINRKNEVEKQMIDILDKPTPLIVNSICISATKEFIVGGTDNNLVCIWKNVGN